VMATSIEPESFLAQLREDTRSEHHAVEKTLGLVEVNLSLSAYRKRLEQFFGFYQPLEDLLFSASANERWPSALLAEARIKTPWLKRDLEALGSSAVERLPLCTNLPDLRDPHARWGCLYVVEGATLGGQVIGKHLRDKLGLHSDTGARFFSAYGARTAENWRAFRELLGLAADTPLAQQHIVASAKATFSALQQWCTEQQGHKT
jgi:heme oxygenase (biliverdin-IX-beta and delta-forming)